MEIKPIFCSECGARLTGSGKFCPLCGSMQAVSPTPTPVTYVQPAPRPNPVTPPPVTYVQPAPVVRPAPVAQPVAVQTTPPQNAISARPAIAFCKGAIILAIFALVLTVVGGLTRAFEETIGLMRNSGRYQPEDYLAYIFDFSYYIKIFLAWVIPALALIAVLVRKKTFALLVTITAAVVVFTQLSLAIMLKYSPSTLYSSPFLFRLLQWVNGSIFLHLWTRLFSGLSSSLGPILGETCFVLKNILALVACTLVALKKKDTPAPLKDTETDGQPEPAPTGDLQMN